MNKEINFPLDADDYDCKFGEPEQTTPEDWPYYWGGKNRHLETCNLVTNSGSFPLDDEDCTCGLAKLEKATPEPMTSLEKLFEDIKNPSVKQVMRHLELLLEVHNTEDPFKKLVRDCLGKLQSLQAENEELKQDRDDWVELYKQEVDIHFRIGKENQQLKARIEEIENDN